MTRNGTQGSARRWRALSLKLGALFIGFVVLSTWLGQRRARHAAGAPARSTPSPQPTALFPRLDSAAGVVTAPVLYASRKDSLAALRTKERAEQATGFRLMVSLQERKLWAILRQDTLFSAVTSVPSGARLSLGAQRWVFTAPPGKREVLGKQVQPVWFPPDWHYVEVANRHGLRVARIVASKPILLSDGFRLAVRGRRVGRIDRTGRFMAVGLDHEIVFDSTLFIPPLGSSHRAIEGELGRFSLDLGDGYLIHGTRDESLVGAAVTHGCFRFRDADIAWLYKNVPVGTPVYIF